MPRVRTKNIFQQHGVDNDKAEAKIQSEIVKYLEDRGWFVKVTHGNAFQSGLPDLYCCHKNHGSRWIEVKKPVGYRFTPAQLNDFPQITSRGVGIWILTAATDFEYAKLFKPCNWLLYLRF